MVQSASLKSNLGHLEPSAAAAGLASLVLAPLDAAVIVANTQLSRQIVTDEPHNVSEAHIG